MNTHNRKFAPVVAAALLLMASGCASRGLVLEMSGSVMYDRPHVESLQHRLSDRRLAGGGVVMRVELVGDPGLEANFDVTPDIAHNRPLTESEPGRYRGEYTFPVEIVGGPFTVIGRLRHDQAGETVVRDPASITIPIEPRPR